MPELTPREYVLLVLAVTKLAVCLWALSWLIPDIWANYRRNRQRG